MLQLGIGMFINGIKDFIGSALQIIITLLVIYFVSIGVLIYLASNEKTKPIAQKILDKIESVKKSILK